MKKRPRKSAPQKAGHREKKPVSKTGPKKERSAEKVPSKDNGAKKKGRAKKAVAEGGGMPRSTKNKKKKKSKPKRSSSVKKHGESQIVQAFTLLLQDELDRVCGKSRYALGDFSGRQDKQFADFFAATDSVHILIEFKERKTEIRAELKKPLRERLCRATDELLPASDEDASQVRPSTLSFGQLAAGRPTPSSLVGTQLSSASRRPQSARGDNLTRTTVGEASRRCHFIGWARKQEALSITLTPYMDRVCPLFSEELIPAVESGEWPHERFIADFASGKTGSVYSEFRNYVWLLHSLWSGRLGSAEEVDFRAIVFSRGSDGRLAATPVYTLSQTVALVASPVRVAAPQPVRA